MKRVTIDVKSKGTVIGTVELDLPESLQEAMADEAKNLAALQYGLRVKAANSYRTGVVGGPKSIPAMIARKLKENPEAMAKVMKLLGLE